MANEGRGGERDFRQGVREIDTPRNRDGSRWTYKEAILNPFCRRIL